jgi:hypothetical protein
MVIRDPPRDPRRRGQAHIDIAVLAAQGAIVAVPQQLKDETIGDLTNCAESRDLRSAVVDRRNH